MKKFIILILLVSLLAFACTANYGTIQPSTVSQEQNTAQNVPAASGVKEFTIYASNFKLTPNEITVKKGDKVKITYISEDTGHNLVIDQFNVKSNVIVKGEIQILEFTADKEGTFSMYCSVGSHRSLGMEGKIIVEA